MSENPTKEFIDAWLEKINTKELLAELLAEQYLESHFIYRARKPNLAAQKAFKDFMELGFKEHKFFEADTLNNITVLQNPETQEIVVKSIEIVTKDGQPARLTAKERRDKMAELTIKALREAGKERAEKEEATRVVTVTISVYDTGRISTNIDCGADRNFQQVLEGLQKAQKEVERQIFERQKCPMYKTFDEGLAPSDVIKI